MKLFELAEEYRRDVATLSNVDLPPEAVLDTIDGMQGEIKEKIKAVIWVAMEMKATGHARMDCAKKMMESAEAELARAENLLTYAQIAIQNSGLVLPIKYTEFTVNLNKNPASCEVTDLAKLPDAYKVSEVKIKVAGDATDAIDKFKAVYGPATLSTTIDVKADKKTLLDRLKQVEQSKGTDKELAPIPGAHILPTAFRMAIK